MRKKVHSEKTSIVKVLEDTSPEPIRTAVGGAILVSSASIAVILLSLLGFRPVITAQIAGGISVFAVAYLMAQLIERVVEPFSENKKLGDTHRTDLLREMIKVLEEKKERTVEENLILLKSRTLLDRLDTRRAFDFWGVTSVLGIVLCFFTAGLFEIVGVSFPSLVVGGGTIIGHAWDSILSGMIVGGGTKPLHDLISYIEKAKQG